MSLSSLTLWIQKISTRKISLYFGIWDFETMKVFFTILKFWKLVFFFSIEEIEIWSLKIEILEISILDLFNILEYRT